MKKISQFHVILLFKMFFQMKYVLSAVLVVYITLNWLSPVCIVH